MRYSYTRSMWTTSTMSPRLEQFLTEDMRTLVRVGYLDGDLEFTDKGYEKLDEILFNKFKKELLEQARKELG